MTFPRKKTLFPFLFHILQGALIGGGAILPGISGGVLSVVFGVYQPMMHTLSSPKDGLRRYWRLFLPVVIGWFSGFWAFALVIDVLFARSETVATCLFIGLILGTLPSLVREGRKNGRSRKAELWPFLISFAVMLALLLFLRVSFTITVSPSGWWFFLCGVLWGLSLIVPGMTSSSILMNIGLFEHMVSGVRELDMGVILPMLAGIAIVVLLLARVVDYCFRRHYIAAFHSIIGVVLASTLSIIPLNYESIAQALLCLVSAGAGFLGALGMERYGEKLQN